METDPLYCPRLGHKNFEVHVYNKDVRDLLKENQHHRRFHDRWGDLQRHVVEARDVGEARTFACSLYPPDDGFVISSVNPLD